MIQKLLGFLFGGGSVKSVSPSELANLLADKNLQLVDVRGVGEFRSGHVAGAVNMPLDKLPSLLANLDRTKATYVVCQSGMRSLRGASILEGAGFGEVFNVSGGTAACRSAGLKIVK